MRRGIQISCIGSTAMTMRDLTGPLGHLLKAEGQNCDRIEGRRPQLGVYIWEMYFGIQST